MQVRRQPTYRCPPFRHVLRQSCGCNRRLARVESDQVETRKTPGTALLERRLFNEGSEELLQAIADACVETVMLLADLHRSRWE